METRCIWGLHGFWVWLEMSGKCGHIFLLRTGILHLQPFTFIMSTYLDLSEFLVLAMSPLILLLCLLASVPLHFDLAELIWHLLCILSVPRGG